MAAGQTAQPVNDWQTVNEPGDWQTVGGNSAPNASSASLFGANGQPSLFDRAKTNFKANTQGAAPGDGTVKGALKNFGAGGGDVIRSLAHPIRTAESMLTPPAPSTDPGLLGKAEDISSAITPPMMPSLRSAVDMGKSLIHQPARTLGQLGTGAILGEGAGRVAGAAAEGASAARGAAMGDPNAAALRGLQVGPRSDAQLSTIRSVENARPYLKGASSQADMQARLPGAMNEVWSPYKQAVEAIGDRPVHFDGVSSTIRQLEAERMRLSALNRGVKAGNPSDIQQVMQEGRTPAQNIEREQAVQSTLDPHLASTGIHPNLIRDTYGSLADVRGGVEGKTTLNEKSQPSGIGRMMNMRLIEPKTLIGEPLQGARDLVAGRPMWSAKPTDLGIKEGFRAGGEKSDLGRVTTTGNPPPPAGLLNAPPREMPAPARGSRVENPTPQNFYHDTDAMRTGRLLNAPPIELGGATEGPKGPPFHFDTTPMRAGRLLPPPAAHLPMSSYSDIFPDQLPSARLKSLIKESR